MRDVGHFLVVGYCMLILELPANAEMTRSKPKSCSCEAAANKDDCNNWKEDLVGRKLGGFKIINLFDLLNT